MKGTILGFDEQSDRGHVRGEDGKRYTFTRADLRTQKAVRGGEEVDFDTDGEAAKDIYVTRGAGVDTAALRDAASKLSGSIVENASKLGSYVSSADTSGISARLKQNSVADLVLGRPAIFYSLLVLFVGFLPYFQSSYLMDSLGVTASRIHLHGHMLYGVASYTAEWADKTHPVFGFFEALSPSIMKAAGAYKDLAKDTRITLYLYYLIPLFALLVLVQEVRGAPSKLLWRTSGILAVGLPFAMSMIIGGLAGVTLASIATNNGAGVQTYTDVMHLYIPTPKHLGFTIGSFCFLAAGVLSLLASFNVIKAPLAYLTPKGTGSD